MRALKIAIRADGSSQIGMGHLMRCLSIALALRDKQAEVIFITKNIQSYEFVTEKGFACRLLDETYQAMGEELDDTVSIVKEQEIQLLLVDSYAATEYYLAELNKEIPVFYMDDLGRMDLIVSGLINYNIYGQNMGYQKMYSEQTALLLGSKYAPIKEAFKNTHYEVRQDVSNILITMGGSDALNIAGQLGEVLLESLPQEMTLTLICGRFSPHLETVNELARQSGLTVETVRPRVQVLTDVSDMWNVMQQCDLAIAAAGSTMYELCAMGVPTICCYYVENQRRIAECFGQDTSMLNAGDFSENPEKVLQNIKEHTMLLIKEPKLRQQLSAEMQKVTDGMGAYRLAEKLMEFAALYC